MRETSLTIDTGKGFTLAASLFSEGDDSDRLVTVACHGLCSTRRSRTLRALIAHLVSTVDVVAFDFRGNGESGGKTSFANYDEEMDDLRCVVTHLRANAGRHVTCVVGHSKGTVATLLYAARHGDIPLAVNVAGRYDFSRQAHAGWFTKEQLAELQEHGQFVWEQGYVIREEDVRRRLRFDITVVRTINPARVRILTVHGSADPTCPVEDAYSYDRLLGPEPAHRLVVVEGASHRFTENVDALGTAVCSWLLEHIEWAKASKT